jgi:hypothetical protein
MLRTQPANPQVALLHLRRAWVSILDVSGAAASVGKRMCALGGFASQLLASEQSTHAVTRGQLALF